MKKIFFIIPVYQVEDYLQRCVDSVLAQTYVNTEIVLVDDGSPDHCPAICDAYKEKHQAVTVIHKQNGGLSDARNAGLAYVMEHAELGDYITFLDSDDFVHVCYAERMLALCEKNACQIAQCGYEKGDKDSFSESNRQPKIFCTDAERALLGYVLKSQSCAKVYQVKTFQQVRFPVGMLNEDEFVTYQAVAKSKKVAFTDENLYYYYQHGSGIMAEIAKKLKNNPHRNDYLKAYDERIAFFEGNKAQVRKTHEKICTDIILRYCEQMYLPKEERDEDCVSGQYLRLYRAHFKVMIQRRGIPIKRRLMYIAFYLFPYSAVFMGKVFTLRK